MHENYKYKYNKYKSKYLDIKYDLTGGGNENIPIIEFYEYVINNYATANLQNTFTSGLTNSNVCGTISTDRNNTSHNINNIYNTSQTSCCDVLIGSNDNSPHPDINIKLNDNYINQFIQHLYNGYRLFPSRSHLSDLKNDNFCPIYIQQIQNVITSITKKYYDFIISNNLHNLNNNHSYIHVVNVNLNEKIIVLGDIHGSLHTFVRILFRLHRYNILNLETFKINNGYRIIFLGDVVDRGNFSLEVVFTILLLIHNNNHDLSNPIVIYNRGNHEELLINSKHGFLDELRIRCNDYDGKILHNNINKLFKLLPSAIIIKTKINHKIYKFWLSHGGFPFNYITHKLIDSNIINLNAIDSKQTRWTDFYQYNNDNSTDIVFNTNRGSLNADVIQMNRKHVAKFLDTNDINFIIRGHQDNYYNSFLFSNKNISGFSIANNKHYNDNNNILIYNDQCELINGLDKSYGPIARLIIDKNKFKHNNNNNNNEMYYTEYISNHEIYPVLTLSTNTDMDRNLSNDSFAIIRFDLNMKNMTDFKNNVFTDLIDLPEKILKN